MEKQFTGGEIGMANKVITNDRLQEMKKAVEEVKVKSESRGK